MLLKIKGFEHYFIDETGNVYSTHKGSLSKLTPYVDSSGRYMMIDLYENGKRKKCLIHRLVASAFLPNPNNHPDIDHKDRNTQNNNVSNLEWVTTKENIRRSYKIMDQYRNCSACLLLLKGKEVASFRSIKEAAAYAAKEYGCSASGLERNLKSKECSIIIKGVTTRGKPRRMEDELPSEVPYLEEIV